MVQTAKSICSDINVVAIPPRFEPPHATGNIAALNANLVTLAQQCGVKYIENPKSFFLSNGDINDGYYYDKVHLTIKGSNKLAHSLGLVSRRSDSEDMCSINASQSSPKSNHGHMGTAPIVKASSARATVVVAAKALVGRRQHISLTPEQRHGMFRRAWRVSNKFPLKRKLVSWSLI